MANYNLFDAASLAMVPTGIKDGKLYSVKPNDGAGDFTFSRGSNLTATRVNADGLIEKGRENLLLQSNAFNDSWINTRSTESNGHSGYDGSNDAWKLQEDNNNGTHKIAQSITQTGIVTASVYAKAAERSAVQFIIESGGSYAGVNFDLTDGSVQSSPAATFTLIDAESTSIGSGWYRLRFAANVTSSASFSIYTLNASFSTSYQGTAGEGVYIQDAQLEQGLVATDYIETTTAPVSAGITENLPRIDYSGGCGSLLLEPQRVNLVTQSELVTTSITNVGYTASENDATSPEGVVNAGKILETTGTTHLVQKTFIVASTTDSYAVSFFIKGIGRTRGTISYELNGVPYNSVSATFNLAEETITDAVASGTGAVAGESGIEPMGNDWYRITLSGVVGIAGTHFVRLFGRDDSGNTSYVGDPTKGFNVYGFQAEAGSYPTSYIPTYGSAATRTHDICTTLNVPSLIGQNEGVIFWQGNVNYLGSDGHAISISGSTSSFGDAILLYRTPSGSLALYIQIAGVPQFGAPLYYDDSDSISDDDKYAIRYAKNNLSVYKNGVKVISASNGNIPATNFLLLNEWNNNFIHQNNTNQVAIFPTALTDNECKALTRPYDTYQEWVDGEGLTWESKSCTVQNIVELQNL